MTDDLVTETKLAGVPLLFRGKVRDIYDLGDRLLLVATDRISAFDVILPTAIPDKGSVLTGYGADTNPLCGAAVWPSRDRAHPRNAPVL